MKKLTIFFTFAFTLLLAATLTAQTVQTGEFQANSKSSGYNLNKNEGTRVFTIEVRFDTPFETTPEVIVSVNYINADTKSKDLRFKVDTSAVTRDGFIIKIETWDDSIIYGIRGNWLAHTK